MITGLAFKAVARILAAFIAFSMIASVPASARPLVIAHRGGTGDTPENTLQAFRTALDNGADALWMTVQLTKDGVPVLYRPNDLGALTDGHGTVAMHDLADIRALNAGYAFSTKDEKGVVSFPYRSKPLSIPTLAEALAAIPSGVPILLDMKQVPAAPLVKAVAQTLDAAHAWTRVRLYSTDAAAIESMRTYPLAHVFETRDATRKRLIEVSLASTCNPPAAGTWAGIELHRQVDVIEHFTLGEGVTHVDARWWTPAAMRCFRTNPDVHVVAFGVETPADYAAAAALGIDAVMTDSPHTLRTELNQ